MESTAQEGLFRVGILAYDGVLTTEFVASLDTFAHAAELVRAWELVPRLEVVTVAPTLREIETAEGLRVYPNHGFSDCPYLDLLVIPSSVGYQREITEREWTRWVAARSDRAKYTLAHGWGSFLLAASGQLQGKKAVTFPAQASSFRQLFPGVELLSDMRFVQDGTIITSSGGLAAYESSLFLTRLIYGDKLARSIAGGLVFSPDNLQYSLPK